MANLLKKLCVYSFAILSIFAISGCNSDNDDDNLKGYWATAPESTVWNNSRIYVYHFINGNTVKYYGDCQSDDSFHNEGKTLKINGKTWYIPHDATTYTYTHKDNKVIIPMQGVILTLSGKTLIEDGSSSRVFTKQ